MTSNASPRARRPASRLGTIPARPRRVRPRPSLFRVVLSSLAAVFQDDNRSINVGHLFRGQVLRAHRILLSQFHCSAHPNWIIPFYTAMAKQIIILNNPPGSSGDTNVVYAFWLTLPAGQQTPNPGMTSAYRGASAAEIASLKTGAVVEEINAGQYPASWTLAQIQGDLQTKYTARQSAISSQANPNLYYGSVWDGTTWTAAAFAPSQQSRFTAANGIINTSGDSTLITGVTNQTISVFALILAAAATVTVQLKDGAGTSMFAASMIAGVPIPLPFNANGEPWFTCSPGNAFVLNLSAAVNVGIRGWYTKA